MIVVPVGRASSSWGSLRGTIGTDHERPQVRGVEGPPSDPRLGARLADEGDRPGRRPARRDLSRHRRLGAPTAAAGLERGVAPRSSTTATRRRSSTTRSGAPTGRSAPTFATAFTTIRTRHVGRQDLTAHVDVTAVERAAATAGLDHLGTTTQAEFLIGLGIGEMLVAAADRSGDHDRGRTSAVARPSMRMLDPAAMGRFRVMLFGRGVTAEPALLGLSFSMPHRAYGRRSEMPRRPAGGAVERPARPCSPARMPVHRPRMAVGRARLAGAHVTAGSGTAQRGLRRGVRDGWTGSGTSSGSPSPG